MVDGLHQREQAAQVAGRKALAREPVQVVARQLGNQAPLVLAVGHLDRQQSLELGRVQGIHGGAGWQFRGRVEAGGFSRPVATRGW